MDIRQLRYVVAAARTMNFTQAAAKLGIAQPALSQAIASLEKEVSVSLFDRNSRRVQLTAAGRLFVERAEKILRDLDSLQHSMHDHAESVRGKVNVGTMVFFFFGTIPFSETVAEFARIHPGVELSIDNYSVDDNLAALRSGKIDVALLNVAEHLEYPDLDFTIVGYDDVVAALPLSHRLAGRPHIQMADLRDELFVVYKPGSTMHETMNVLSREAAFVPRAAAQSRNIVLVRSLVSAGVGVSVGPKSYLMSPGPPVAIVPLVPLHRISITMVTRPIVQSNPAARALVEFMRDRLCADSEGGTSKEKRDDQGEPARPGIAAE